MDISQIHNELKFKATRSSGPGGQHVNKTASKIELFFDVENSEGLQPEEKEVITAKLGNRISKEGILILTCQESRSQHKNKEKVTQQLIELLKKSLVKPKKRKATKPTKSSLLKKAKSKQNQSLKKQLRQKPKLD